MFGAKKRLRKMIEDSFGINLLLSRGKMPEKNTRPGCEGRGGNGCN